MESCLFLSISEESSFWSQLNRLNAFSQSSNNSLSVILLLHLTHFVNTIPLHACELSKRSTIILLFAVPPGPNSEPDQRQCHESAWMNPGATYVRGYEYLGSMEEK